MKLQEEYVFHKNSVITWDSDSDINELFILQ